MRIGQHVAGVAFLNQVPPAQHHDAVGHLRHHRQIVGDVDGGGVELPHDVLDRGQDLDLSRHVERRSRFVEHDQIGPAGHRHGRHGALQLAARYLVGIAVADRVGVRQLQFAEQDLGVGFGLGLPLNAMLDRGFRELIDQPMSRIEGGGGALGHVGYAHAAQLALGVLAGGHQVDAVELNLASRNAAAGAGIAHGGEADGRLAGARFADEAEYFATAQIEIDAVDDFLPLLVGLALDAQAAHGENDVVAGTSAHRAIHLFCAGRNRRQNSRPPSAAQCCQPEGAA